MKQILCKFENGIKDNFQLREIILEEMAKYGCTTIHNWSTSEKCHNSGIDITVVLHEFHFNLHTYYFQNYYLVDIASSRVDHDLKSILKDLAKKTNSTIMDVVELDRD